MWFPAAVYIPSAGCCGAVREGWGSEIEGGRGRLETTAPISAGRRRAGVVPSGRYAPLSLSLSPLTPNPIWKKLNPTRIPSLLSSSVPGYLSLPAFSAGFSLISLCPSPPYPSLFLSLALFLSLSVSLSGCLCVTVCLRERERERVYF